MLKIQKIILLLLIWAFSWFPAIVFAHDTGEFVFYSLVMLFLWMDSVLFIKSALYSLLHRQKFIEAMIMVGAVGIGEFIIVRIAFPLLKYFNPQHHAPGLDAVWKFYLPFAIFINVFLAKPKNVYYLISIKNVKTLFFAIVFTSIVPACFYGVSYVLQDLVGW